VSIFASLRLCVLLLHPFDLAKQLPADDVQCPREGEPRRSFRVAALLLQLRQASQGTEIRTRGQDTGYAGRDDHEPTDDQGDLHLAEAFFVLQNVTVVFFDTALLADVDDSHLFMAA
jgi:hypothetical protein